jgi:hypothetical protein
MCPNDNLIPDMGQHLHASSFAGILNVDFKFMEILGYWGCVDILLNMSPKRNQRGPHCWPASANAYICKHFFRNCY